MTTLLAIAYPDMLTAESVKLELLKAQEDYLIALDDIVIAERTKKGKVKLHQATSLTAMGALDGTFWGTLVGALFMTPVLGAAVGATTGALSGALSDIGIEDYKMKDLASELENGGAALFVLVRSATEDKVIERVANFGGTVLRSNLSITDEEILQQKLAATTAEIAEESA